MIDHDAVLLAARNRALSLVVCTTGATTLVATATGYTRAAGSFLADGFRVGMEVTPAGFTDTTPRTIAAVDATTMTVEGAVTPQASGSGRTLSVGLPSQMSYLGVPLATPGHPTPWAEEQYLAGPAAQVGLTTTATVENLPQYALSLYARLGAGAAALLAYASGLLDHFPPGLPLTLASGDDLRVRAVPAPFASPVAQVDGRWLVTTVTIPLRLHTANSR